MIRSDGSLYIPTDWTRKDPRGRFMKGHVPHNKGKKMNEWMSEESQRNVRKGWENLDKYRNCHGRADNAGRSRKMVVAVHNNGRHHIFRFAGAAAGWLGGSRENICRCCRNNQARHENKKTGKINTDHQYKGIRWYFATDPIWQEKIGHDIVI